MASVAYSCHLRTGELAGVSSLISASMVAVDAVLSRYYSMVSKESVKEEK